MINEKEYDKIIKTRFKDLENYIEEHTIPDLVAFYIFSGFNNSTLWETTLNKTINTCLEYINLNIDISIKLINSIKNILITKYNIDVVNENPLSLILK